MIDNSFLGVLSLAAVVIGGLGAILGGLSVVLHAIASRTKTTVDDRLAADVDAAHAKLDQVLDLLRGVAPVSSAPIAPQPNSSTAKVGSVASIALLALAIGGVSLVPACHTVEPALASGIIAALDCEAANFAPQDLADATKFADATVQHWLAGGPAASTDAIKTDLAPFKSNLSKCALAGSLALATTALAPPSSSSTPGTVVQGLTSAAAVAPPPGPVQARATFGVAARQLGWPPIKVAGGTVL